MRFAGQSLAERHEQALAFPAGRFLDRADPGIPGGFIPWFRRQKPGGGFDEVDVIGVDIRIDRPEAHITPMTDIGEFADIAADCVPERL